IVDRPNSCTAIALKPGRVFHQGRSLADYLKVPLARFVTSTKSVGVVGVVFPSQLTFPFQPTGQLGFRSRRFRLDNSLPIHLSFAHVPPSATASRGDRRARPFGNPTLQRKPRNRGPGGRPRLEPSLFQAPPAGPPISPCAGLAWALP